MSRIKLTPGGLATKVVHIARPKGHNTLARDIHDLDRDHPILEQSE
jgi:hypothetical protein